MKIQFVMLAAASVLLTSCGGGVSTPSELRGTWSDSCPAGMLQIDADSLHILYPSRKDFTLTASEFDGKTWKASFEIDGKKITDVYIYEAGTLRAEQVIVDGATFNSDKTRLTKCS